MPSKRSRSGAGAPPRLAVRSKKVGVAVAAAAAAAAAAERGAAPPAATADAAAAAAAARNARRGRPPRRCSAARATPDSLPVAAPARVATVVGAAPLADTPPGVAAGGGRAVATAGARQGAAPLPRRARRPRRAGGRASSPEGAEIKVAMATRGNVGWSVRVEAERQG